MSASNVDQLPGLTASEDDVPNDIPSEHHAAVFVVDDERKANWLVKRIGEARAYRERVKQWAADETARSQRDEERLLYLYGGQLREWATTEITKLQGRRKSIHLPGGQVGFRHEQPKLVVIDEAAAIEWARLNCPEAIQIVEKFSRNALKAHFDETGEIPPAVKFLPAHEGFFIR
jgi:Bacteriophage Mu Gam like protein